MLAYNHEVIANCNESCLIDLLVFLNTLSRLILIYLDYRVLCNFTKWNCIVGDLLNTATEKWLIPLVFSLGGQLFAGLLSRQRFRREFKRHKESLVELQNLYNTLVWNKLSPDSFDREVCSYSAVGCFSWAELTTCTKLSILSYSDVRDRESLRRFLTLQEDFKGLINYFEIPIDEAIEKGCRPSNKALLLYGGYV